MGSRVFCVVRTPVELHSSSNSGWCEFLMGKAGLRPVPFPMTASEARILVVDDEPAILISLQAILREDGYHVDTAADGRSAISAIRSRNYDLVLTDLKLPG